tara:strand:- start:888 stop:1241 length:354 start_codon:yes stop_codon:yes gene_type:complete
MQSMQAHSWILLLLLLLLELLLLEMLPLLLLEMLPLLLLEMLPLLLLEMLRSWSQRLRRRLWRRLPCNCMLLPTPLDMPCHTFHTPLVQKIPIPHSARTSCSPEQAHWVLAAVRETW